MKSGRNRGFVSGVNDFCKRAEDSGDKIVQTVCADLFSRVILDTPVDTGRARGNWVPAIGAPSNSVDNNKFDGSGQSTVSAAVSVSRSAKMGDTIHLTNNLPYIKKLENGYSKKSPRGMVGINVTAIQSKYGGIISR